MAEGIAGLLNKFRKKEEEEPVDPKAPIPIHEIKVPKFKESIGELYPARIKFRGLYDLDALYKFMTNWLRQRRYRVYETLYKARGQELEIKIRGEREKSGFVMEVLTIDYISYGEYDIDVVQNGKKKKMTNARMLIRIGGDILAPYSDIFGNPRWTKSAMERRLLNLFRNWFMKRDLEAVYWDTLYYEMQKLQGAIKDVLKMEAKGNVYESK